MERRGGLGPGAISRRKVVFIKLSMAGDIKLRGDGIKIMKPLWEGLYPRKMQGMLRGENL